MRSRARSRRSWRVAAIGMLMLTLGGCLSLPTDGAVEQGLEGPPAEQGPELVAPGPSENASPQQIVQGFLLASSLGLGDDFARAHEYMTTAGAAQWDPLGGATIYSESASVTIDVGTESADEIGVPVTVTVPVSATVGPDGTYTEAAVGTVQELEFRLIQVAGEQWRISQLPPGMVMSEVTFGTQFRDVSIYFLSGEAEPRLVPDLRWLPRSRSVVASVRALLTGPAEWLAPPAIVTAFPDGTELDIEGVEIDDRVATVALTSEFLSASAADRAYAQHQLAQTLRPLGQVSQVRITVDGSLLNVDESLAPVGVNPVPVRGPVVIRGDQLGVLTGDTVAVEDDAVSVPDDVTRFALPYGDGAALGLVGSSSLVAFGEGIDPTAVLAPGGSLVPPSFDVHGWVWTSPTGPASNGGALLVVDPVSGEAAAVEASDLNGADVVALRVSREGARLTYAVRTDDSIRVYAAAIVRGADGRPVSVSPGQRIGPVLAVLRDLVWVDEVQVAALGATVDGDVTVRLIGVGGQTAPLPSVEGAVAIAAGDGPREIFLATSEGELFGRSGNGWRVVEDDVRAPTFSG